MEIDPVGGSGGGGPAGAASPDAAVLFGKAEQCRRLAAGISDRQAAEVLRKMAVRYERSAEGLAAR